MGMPGIDSADQPNSAMCGAHRRDGTPCEARPASGKRRCRVHGGAPGSGAPKGNRNALKTGAHTAATRARIKAMRDYVRASRSLMDAVDAGARSAALLRRHAAVEHIADQLATTTQRLLGE